VSGGGSGENLSKQARKQKASEEDIRRTVRGSSKAIHKNYEKNLGPEKTSMDLNVSEVRIADGKIGMGNYGSKRRGGGEEKKMDQILECGKRGTTGNAGKGTSVSDLALGRRQEIQCDSWMA